MSEDVTKEAANKRAWNGFGFAVPGGNGGGTSTQVALAQIGNSSGSANAQKGQEEEEAAEGNVADEAATTGDNTALEVRVASHCCTPFKRGKQLLMYCCSDGAASSVGGFC